MTTNRVRLTEAAATRFPDLAGRTGTTRATDLGCMTWCRVEWSGMAVWLRGEDLEFVPDHEPELPSLDPSDPNAPAP